MKGLIARVSGLWMLDGGRGEVTNVLRLRRVRELSAELNLKNQQLQAMQVRPVQVHRGWLAGLQSLLCGLGGTTTPVLRPRVATCAPGH